MCSVCVLSKEQFRETFHKLLICLSILDSSFILCAVFTLLIRYEVNNSNVHQYSSISTDLMDYWLDL